MEKRAGRLEIPRESPTVNALIAKKAIGLTWYNTALYRFSERYKHIDHINIRVDENEKYNVFGSPALMQILEEKQFPLMIAQEPSDNDIESYLRYEETRLESRIGNISE